jgi:hypothetical protein
MIYITSRHLFLLLLKERSSQQSDAAGKEREASKSAHRYPIHDPWIYYGRCARKEEYAHTRIKRSTLLSCFCPNFCQIFKTKGWVIQKKNSLDTLGGGGTDNAIKVFLPLAAFSFYENLFFSIWSDSLFFSRSLATLLGLAGLQRSSCKLCVWSTSSLMRIDLHNPSREVPIYLFIYLSTRSCYYWAGVASWRFTLCLLAAKVALCFTRAAKVSHGSSGEMGWFCKWCGESGKL